jgi:hypothetical protein
MKADRSRNTYAPGRHYRRVLHQQGRVVLDADLNEQTSIDVATAQTTAADVIGAAGVPETSLSGGAPGGFALGIGAAASSSSASSSSSSSASFSSGSSSSSSSSGSALGNDLTIAAGRIYVDGILVENDRATTLLTQPFLPLAPGETAPTGLVGAGVYAAYLDVWERVVTPIDDPHVQEVALGGPDTCLRAQIAWQVRLARLGPLPGTNPTCAQVAPPWPQRPDPGRMTASLGAPPVDASPCALPPESGFRSLENQLYRVEIHAGGTYGSARFKWSRENGAIVFAVVPAPGQPASGSAGGTTYHVSSTGRDASLGVKHGDWVELSDDRAELQDGHGELLQVDSVDDDRMTITLQSAPSRPVDLALHPKLRRWDQSLGADASGVPIVDGSVIALENGVQVQFSAGTFVVGDYWMVAARTATAQQRVGTIEWPVDGSGQFLAQPPLGIAHHYCKLGIVAFDGVGFMPPPGGAAITDCRVFFPPLTDIHAQACKCTVTLLPDGNWTATLAALFSGAGALADAEICFAAGDFRTSRTVDIQTSGNVVVGGAGWGTRLIGDGIETVLRFRGCASVIVRDLAATATRADTPVDAATRHIGGALAFEDCAEVDVERVSLQCASAATSGAACLVVQNTVTAGNAGSGAGVVRVRDSRLVVGEMQYGALLVHARDAWVDGNTITRAGGNVPSFGKSLQGARFRKLVERILVGGVTLAAASVQPPAPPARKSRSRKPGASAAAKTAAAASATPAPSAVAKAVRATNAEVKVGNIAVRFNTPPQLKNVWQTYVDAQAPKEFASQADLLAFVRRSASTLLTDAAQQRQFTGFRELFRYFESSRVLVGRAGIVVGGRAITSLRVSDNVIDGFLQGVAVGLSHREAAPSAQSADRAGSVTIRDNRIALLIDPIHGRAAGRYGVFVGNVDSLQIENNRATLSQTVTAELPTDGVRVFGYLGTKAIVRENHLSGFTTGIRVAPVMAPGVRANGDPQPVQDFFAPVRTAGPQWLVADNMVDRARTPVVAPQCMVIDNVSA